MSWYQSNYYSSDWYSSDWTLNSTSPPPSTSRSGWYASDYYQSNWYKDEWWGAETTITPSPRQGWYASEWYSANWKKDEWWGGAIVQSSGSGWWRLQKYLEQEVVTEPLEPDTYYAGTLLSQIFSGNQTENIKDLKEEQRIPEETIISLSEEIEQIIIKEGVLERLQTELSVGLVEAQQITKEALDSKVQNIVKITEGMLDDEEALILILANI